MANPIIIQASGSTITTIDTRSLASIRERVLKNLGADSEYFQNEDIDEYINQALDECAEITQAIEKTSLQNTVSGTYLYNLESDVIQVKSICYDNNMLKKVELSTIISLYGGNSPETVTGKPYYWAQYSLNQIWVFPTPNEIKTLSIISSVYDTPLANDSDYSSFLRAVDKLCEYFATYMLALRDDEHGKASAYKALYDKLKRRFKLLSKKRPRQTAAQYSGFFNDIGGDL